MPLEKNKIYNLDALSGLRLLDDESVDTIITSPPYYGLRDYDKAKTIFGGDPDCAHDWIEAERPGMMGGPRGDTTQRHFSASSYQTCSKCGAWLGQLGLEPDVSDYISHLVMIFTEAWRVLKPTGSLWVVIGDSYSGSGIGTNDYRTEASRSINKSSKPHPKVSVTQRLKSVKAKSLILIPHRFALAMSEAGWIVRNEVIWHKPNCMPESVRDRFTRDFEHIFFFTKSRRYYFEQILEPLTPGAYERVKTFVKNGERFDPTRHKLDPTGRTQSVMNILSANAEKLFNSPYRNKRAVWKVAPGSYSKIHFAVFPEALVEPMIRATCPADICPQCGLAWRRVYRQTERERRGLKDNDKRNNVKRGDGRQGISEWSTLDSEKFLYESYNEVCDCGVATHPGLVVDPFMGSGTTAAVALKLGRDFIGFELNPDYVKIADERIEKVRHGLQLGLNLIT